LRPLRISWEVVGMRRSSVAACPRGARNPTPAGKTRIMPSPLDVARLPLRVVDDIARITEAVTQLPLLLADVRNDVHGLAVEIEGLTLSLEQMERRLARMEKGIDPLDDDLASVEKGMHALPPKLDGLREQIEALRTDLSGLPFVGKS
jgi:uncharacterized coiled-coil protein SlyX